MNNKLSKQDKEKLDNKIVFLSSIVLIYGILLMFIQKMAYSSMTVSGAIAFVQILRWVSLAGAMLCAAWSAYKEKRDFFTYCGACIFVFFSTTIILYCGRHGKAYLINYLALIITFIMIQIYAFMKSKDMFAKKSVRVIFIAVSLVLIAFIAVLSLLQVFM